MKTAKDLVEELGENLIGKQITTMPIGSWPGGISTVKELEPDPAAPEIVMQVESDFGHGEIGIFEDEQCYLLTRG